jgi:hypothetical protein
MRSKRLREAALAANTDPEQKKDQYLGWGGTESLPQYCVGMHRSGSCPENLTVCSESDSDMTVSHYLAGGRTS